MKHREDIGILRKALNKFSRYQIHLQGTERDRNKAKANIYRHLANFQLSIDEVMKKFEVELIEANVKEYFPDLDEKVMVASLPNGEKYIEVVNFKGGDKRAAIKQQTDRQKFDDKHYAEYGIHPPASSSISDR